MDSVTVSSLVETIKNNHTLSILSKGILILLIMKSEKFLLPVAVTVKENDDWKEISEATGEMEDFAAIINPYLIENGSALEIFSGPGFWDGKKFIQKVNENPDQKRRATFWLCRRGEFFNKLKKEEFFQNEIMKISNSFFQ